MDKPDFDAIEAEIRAACGDNVVKFSRIDGWLNYGETWGFAVKRKDGSQIVVYGGLMNYPDLDPETEKYEIPDGWEPVLWDIWKSVPEAIKLINSSE